MPLRCTPPTSTPLAMLAVAACLLVVTPRTASAQHACAALSAADVATVIGSGAASKEFPGGALCNWTAASGPKKLQVGIGPYAPGSDKDFDESYASPGKQPMGDVERESGLGDKALCMTLRYGITFQVVKGAKMLMLGFSNRGTAPSKADHDALRALAEKIVATM